MGSGIYAAYTALLGRTQALDTAANNLANTGANGFRATKNQFADVLAGQTPLASQLGKAVNDFGVLAGNIIDLSQGQLTKTGNPTDVAINGPGFFAVKGPTGVLYTRDGAFQTNQAGTLVNSQQQPVLDASGNTITIPSGQVSIGTDGTISVGGGVVGKIGISNFAADTDITEQGNNQYVVPAGTKTIPTTATLQQGMLESANQDAIKGTLQLILFQRQAQMMQKALTVFNNDFDKTASEDLPKV